jgi:hypothetical protein
VQFQIGAVLQHSAWPDFEDEDDDEDENDEKAFLRLQDFDFGAFGAKWFGSKR